MVYECDKCSAPLPPGVNICPKCGEKFDDVVPANAEVPRIGFSPAVSAPPPPTVSQPDPNPVYAAPAANSAKNPAPSSGFSVLRVLVALPIILGIMIGAALLTSSSKDSTGTVIPSPISSAINPQHSVTYKVTGRSSILTW